MRPVTVLFMGSQGAGKGTQARLLIEYLEKNDPDHKVLFHNAGSRFREFVEGDSFTQKIVRASLERGELQPVFFSVLLWTQSFIDKVTSNDIHFVIDGSPRSLLEAEVLEDALEFYKHENSVVLYINIDAEIAVERLVKRGRSDDTEEGIRERHKWHEEQTLPIVEYYRKRPYCAVIEIDGNGTVEEVHKDIVEKLEQHFS